MLTSIQELLAGEDEDAFDPAARTRTRKKKNQEETVKLTQCRFCGPYSSRLLNATRYHMFGFFLSFTANRMLVQIIRVPRLLNCTWKASS